MLCCWKCSMSYMLHQKSRSPGLYHRETDFSPFGSLQVCPYLKVCWALFSLAWFSCTWCWITLKVFTRFLPPKCSAPLVYLLICPSCFSCGPWTRAGHRGGALGGCCTDFLPRCLGSFHWPWCWLEYIVITKQRPRSYKRIIVEVYNQSLM